LFLTELGRFGYNGTLLNEEKPMVSLRMQRVGRPKTSHYRIVAVDSRKARDAAGLEVIGHYHPREKSQKITVNADRLKYWLGQGAQPSDTLRTALKTAGAWAVPLP
jgi:small subunit ribosomal protein S16